MIQIIASDMDGTLLNDKMTISPQNAAAIKKAQAQGVHFVVATGRERKEAWPLLQEAGITCPMITINGAQVFDEAGKQLSATPIPKELAARVIRGFKKNHLYCEVVTSRGTYSDNKASRIENFAQLLANVNVDTPFKLAVSLASARMEIMNIQYTDSYFDLLADPHLSILKIVGFSADGPQVLDPIKQEMLTFGPLSITSSSSNNIEVNIKDANKGHALATFADSLNIPLDNVMAVGDNNNDVPMLKVAGVSFAMGNGSTEVKKLANYITDINTADGVAKAIEKALTLD
ncbi:Cof-type HAD-IIB family hydrolase [Ligilactobacillus saerimneri]|uniref:Cof-type HAD-IIB family hydrolase n=1 Tax=Ligilactobacillus saerimneri TaxID=228229 RepID=UPI0022A66564|nr:Cof-type HAD-IIB family hydrolase [Ligilactobacillus saerimneri]MCZ0890914.1 Cof-type HAD-IIB family hydrolase [Ligilactobacillus saerimneri]